MVRQAGRKLAGILYCGCSLLAALRTSLDYPVDGIGTIQSHQRSVILHFLALLADRRYLCPPIPPSAKTPVTNHPFTPPLTLASPQLVLNLPTARLRPASLPRPLPKPNVSVLFVYLVSYSGPRAILCCSLMRHTRLSATPNLIFTNQPSRSESLLLSFNVLQLPET